MRLRDNSLGSLRAFCVQKLSEEFTPAEIRTIVSEMFSTFHSIESVKLETQTSSRFSESEILQYHFALKRILRGEPLQYVCGRAHFYRRLFKVSNSVLIPRPETEELCELIISENRNKRPLKILDACTGSGCIAVTLYGELQGSLVSAFDIDPKALELAIMNAHTYKSNIRFLEADLSRAETLPFESWDIIVSNPPYVLESDKINLHKNVFDFEPHIALFVPDDDPLLFYRHLARYAVHHLNPCGILYVEINEKKADAICELFAREGLADTAIIKDLSGKDRIVRAINI